MINFPPDFPESDRIKICSMLLKKDNEIEQLKRELGYSIDNEDRTRNLRSKYFFLFEKYLKLYWKEKGYTILDVNYPKDFGKGYEISDFAPGTFIEEGYFIIPNT